MNRERQLRHEWRFLRDGLIAGLLAVLLGVILGGDISEIVISGAIGGGGGWTVARALRNDKAD